MPVISRFCVATATVACITEGACYDGVQGYKFKVISSLDKDDVFKITYANGLNCDLEDGFGLVSMFMRF